MREQTSSLAAEIETVTEIYAAINRNDIPATMKLFDAQMEWIEPPYYPGAGTHRGHAEVMANASKGRNTWAEGSCELEGFTVAGDMIFVFVRAHVRLKDHTEWIDGRFADRCLHVPRRQGNSDAVVWGKAGGFGMGWG